MMDMKVWLLALLIFAQKLSDGQGRQHPYGKIQAHTHTHTHTPTHKQTHTHTQGTIEFWA